MRSINLDYLYTIAILENEASKQVIFIFISLISILLNASAFARNDANPLKSA